MNILKNLRSSMHKKAFTIATLLSIILVIYAISSTSNIKYTVINTYNDLDTQSIDYNKTMVIFDVDDTLIECDLDFSLPSRLWITLCNPSLLDQKNWRAFASQLWISANFRIIEPQVSDIINQLKKKGCTILALTSMESGSYGIIKSMPEWRYQHLKNLGILFSQKFNNVAFEDLPTYLENHPTLYKGILCANQQPKGLVLDAFLKRFNLKPELIIHIDDEISALESVQKVCGKNHIVCKSYQYKK